MKEMNVYNFCSMFCKGQEIRLHVWTFNPDNTETCIHKTFTDRFDSELFKYRNAEVTQFSCVKRNCIEIIATIDNRIK